MPAARDLILPCAGAGHRVRLRGGRHLLAAATCPRCRAPVDPLRWQRLVAVVVGLARPRSPEPLDRAVWGLSLATVLAVVLGTLVFRLTADVWWPATTLLFGPRWVLVLPVLAVTGLAAWRDRALIGPLVAALAILVWSVLGFRLNPSRVLLAERPGDLRIATLNVAGGRTLTSSPGDLLDEFGVDVLIMQECGRRTVRGAADRPDRFAERWGLLCVVSRWALSDERAMDGTQLRAAGGSALAVTWTLDAPGGPVALTAVHLETPRDGFELLLQGRIGAGAEALRQKSLLREIELRRSERWAASHAGPRIVAGDFNTPPESRILRRHWSGWTDAFAARGFGVGGTRLNGWIRPRIDYVMADDDWTVVEARVGPHVGSDHLPVIAVLRRRAR